MAREKNQSFRSLVLYLIKCFFLFFTDRARHIEEVQKQDCTFDRRCKHAIKNQRTVSYLRIYRHDLIILGLGFFVIKLIYTYKQDSSLYYRRCIVTNPSLFKNRIFFQYIFYCILRLDELIIILIATSA